jgi:hypothetical protein
VKRVLIALSLVAALASCGSGSGSQGLPGTCGALAGKPVHDLFSCDPHGLGGNTNGSFGCFQHGVLTELRWITDTATEVAGPDGGVWRSVPVGMDEAAMRKEFGCDRPR